MSGMELQRRNAPGPQVIHPIPDANRRGMIALFTLSLFSVITTGALVAWLTYRLIFWRRYYTRYPGRNQFIVLIYNLLIADLHQALANMVSPYWLIKDMVSTYSPACFAQGWLINVGNIASGMFVLAIAVHTFVNVVTRKTLGHGVFVGSVIGVWIFSIVVTLIGPALRGIHIYAPTGAWVRFPSHRLFLSGPDLLTVPSSAGLITSMERSVCIYITSGFLLPKSVSSSSTQLYSSLSADA